VDNCFLAALALQLGAVQSKTLTGAFRSTLIATSTHCELKAQLCLLR
jgi:hypothetical protein